MENQLNFQEKNQQDISNENLTADNLIGHFDMFAQSTDEMNLKQEMTVVKDDLIPFETSDSSSGNHSEKNEVNLTAKIAQDGKRHDATMIANHQLLDKIAMQRVFEPNRSLLKTLFPGKEEKLARDSRLQLVGSAIQQRIIIHRLYTDYMAQGVKATLETRLMCMEAKQRAEAARVLSADYKILCVEIANTLTGFIRLLNQKHKQLDTILSPTLKQVAAKDLEMEERNTITFLRHLVTNFELVAQRKINGLSI